MNSRNDFRIGFMQGRLSPIIENRIQAFPRFSWEDEFEKATSLGMNLMEWTIDSIEFQSNPLLTTEGRIRIQDLCDNHKFFIPSVTCDYFMENPFWKPGVVNIYSDLLLIIQGMSEIKAQILVIPLVDNSSMAENEEKVIEFFNQITPYLMKANVRVAFELDLNPKEASQFINEFPADTFGINYDIGNSAALGFNPIEEFQEYGERVLNVHVKDRLIKGTTVRLGEGAANFELVFKSLAIHNYKGNYIMQTARAKNGDHISELATNINFLESALNNAHR
jgi:L-ribulose-5-phosphate 3-epimerase